jgi:hypothetical protein
MRKLKLLGAFASLLSISFVAGAVHGTTWASGAGNYCVGDGVNGVIDHGTFGATYRGSNVGYAYCSLPLGTQSDYPQVHSNMAINYYDATDTGQFSCFACQSFSGGSASCSTVKYTCSTWGGCNDPTTAFIGWNTLVWYQSDLGSNVYNQYVDANVYVFCAIPAVDPQTGASSILQVWATL